MSSSYLQQESLIFDQFFGKMVVEIHQNMEFTNSEDEAFNLIYLDIRHHDIYQAWDEYMINIIDDYKNDQVFSLFLT